MKWGASPVSGRRGCQISKNLLLFKSLAPRPATSLMSTTPGCRDFKRVEYFYGTGRGERTKPLRLEMMNEHPTRACSMKIVLVHAIRTCMRGRWEAHKGQLWEYGRMPTQQAAPWRRWIVPKDLRQGQTLSEEESTEEPGCCHRMGLRPWRAKAGRTGQRVVPGRRLIGARRRGVRWRGVRRGGQRRFALRVGREGPRSGKGF